MKGAKNMSEIQNAIEVKNLKKGFGGRVLFENILLMDEPTSGVDPISRVEIRSLIEALKADGKTVIITSHDLSEIEKCADDVSMIKNGRLLFDKGIQEMQGQSLEEIFIKEGNRHE